jgi:hypothetical protein
MEAMRQSWSDDRLDDLNRRVDDGFTQLRGEMNDGFTQLRGEMNEGFTQLRGEANEGFTQLRREFNALNRTLLQVGGGLIGTVIAASAAIVIAVA